MSGDEASSGCGCGGGCPAGRSSRDDAEQDLMQVASRGDRDDAGRCRGEWCRKGSNPCIAHTHLARHVVAVLQPEDRWTVVAAVDRRLVGDRGLLLRDDVRVGGTAAQTRWRLREDAEVVVDEEERWVAAELQDSRVSLNSSPVSRSVTIAG